MSLNGVSGKAFFDKMNSGYKANQKAKEEKGQEFSGNLEGMKTQEPESGKKNREEISGKQTEVSMEYQYGMTATELLLQRNGRVKMRAVTECGVRHISYEESDYVKSFAVEGFTLKAKVEMDAHRVYIEQKNEDGTYQAYEVNPLQLSGKAKNPMEQMALDAWELARDLLNDGMVTEIKPGEAESKADAAQEGQISAEFLKRLEEFKAYVKERIKEGPPKIPTGGSEFSEEEWDRLMAKIDKEIDAYKEELRERIRKRQGEDPVSREAGSAVKQKSLAETAGVEAGEEGKEETLISENEALADGAGGTRRGSSFLARLSGEKKAPYSYMADETGIILYNGVTFVCDDKKQQICLGDVSNPKNVITIPLSGGGCLKVNRDNLGELAKSIGMFSAEDIGRIMRAIAKDNKAREFEFYLEEMQSEVL